MRRRHILILAALFSVVLAGCAGMGAGGAGGSGMITLETGGPDAVSEEQAFMPGDVSGLELVAQSERQWTGVAVSKTGRIFVCFPRWSDDVPVSVAEILPGGRAVPYPDAEWNKWNESLSPRGHFICVQSLYADDENCLWILDPANPKFEGVIETGPKLIKVDLATNTVSGRYYFDEYKAPPGSYLNDVRVDREHGFAYITDSGLGAILVVNLANRKTRRLLEFDHVTKSEGLTLTFDGRPWLRPNGTSPEVHSDGIALSPDGSWLYFQALTGATLYRVPTADLQNVLLPTRKLRESVEQVAKSGPADGIMFGPDGGLYITAIQENAIRRLNPDGTVETVISDDDLAWPDSFARGMGGAMYVTTSRINLVGDTSEPYRLFRFRVEVPEEPGDSGM